MTRPARAPELEQAPSRAAGRPAIRAFSRPYSPYHDVYQRYYQEGLRRQAARTGAAFEVVSLSPAPWLLRPLRLVRDRNYLARLRVSRANALLDAVGRRVEGGLRTPSGHFQPTVGQYLLFAPDGSRIRFCIDASDSHEIANDPLREWSDVYFKTNEWDGHAYPANVRPMANCDPLVLGRLPALRRLRATPKDVDVSFVVRIWGGRDGTGGIEHNLKLFAAVSRARCSKRLLAIVNAGDVDESLRHLRQAGVPATTRGISPKELWAGSAAARLNVFRLGVHYCVPWRMTGALAMGSCIVLDRPPFSRWPEPLGEEGNFLSLGTLVSPDEPVASDAAYAEIPDRIEAWLARPDLLEEIRVANGSYFDRHLEPSELGRAIVGALS